MKRARKLGAPAREGQTLVELALVLPFLIFLAAGILDVGLLVFANLELTGAAQEVTKVASFNEYTPAQLEAMYRDQFSVVGTKTLAVTTVAADPDLANRPAATITMTLTFPPAGLAALFRGTDFTFTSVARTPVMTNRGTPGALVPD